MLQLFKRTSRGTEVEGLQSVQVRSLLQLRLLESILALSLGRMHVFQEGADVSSSTNEATFECFVPKAKSEIEEFWKEFTKIQRTAVLHELQWQSHFRQTH